MFILRFESVYSPIFCWYSINNWWEHKRFVGYIAHIPCQSFQCRAPSKNENRPLCSSWNWVVLLLAVLFGPFVEILHRCWMFLIWEYGWLFESKTFPYVCHLYCIKTWKSAWKIQNLKFKKRFPTKQLKTNQTKQHKTNFVIRIVSFQCDISFGSHFFFPSRTTTAKSTPTSHWATESSNFLRSLCMSLILWYGINKLFPCIKLGQHSKYIEMIELYQQCGKIRFRFGFFFPG